MNFQTDYEIAIQLLISFAVGTAIGLEREYRSKAAGLRTMIMICLGSTIFTQISIHVGVNSPDRIASTIVTGVGFLGAGVIFKDGLNITGITTATTIWISAALGMAIGAGEYFVGMIGSAFVLIVLIVFEKLQYFIEQWHQTRVYKISLPNSSGIEKLIVKEIEKLNLGYKKKRDLKLNNQRIVVFEVYGKENKLERFNRFLHEENSINTFEY
jgi:putative Mg2+ transporter-C (MgtC) family protein